jgi:hypothetical protein
MGGAGNTGQEPGDQTAATGGGTTPLPGWGTAGATPGNPTGPQTGVPPPNTLPESLRPYELETPSVGSGPATGLLAPGAPSGALGFNSNPYPTHDEVPTYGAPAPPPAAAAVDTDPWGGRVQIYGTGAEGFATDTQSSYMQRWPSWAQAEQKPGTDTWWLPKGVTR